MSKFVCLTLAVVLILGYAHAAEETRPAICPCPKIMAPVCGTDERTYTNECELKCAAKTRSDLRVAHPGNCKDAVEESRRAVDNENLGRCFCTFDFRQVCASNGRTYDNPCLLQCAARRKAGLKMVHEGPCEPIIDSNSIA